jgi:curved DNA-binding protein CbpA
MHSTPRTSLSSDNKTRRATPTDNKMTRTSHCTTMTKSVIFFVIIASAAVATSFTTIPVTVTTSTNNNEKITQRPFSSSATTTFKLDERRCRESSRTPSRTTGSSTSSTTRLFYDTGGYRPDQVKDHYAVLGVRRSSDKATIKKAYRTLAKMYHPDLNPSPDASDKFKELNVAYEILSDEELRFHYDEMGGAGVAASRATASANYGHHRQPQHHPFGNAYNTTGGFGAYGNLNDMPGAYNGHNNANNAGPNAGATGYRRSHHEAHHAHSQGGGSYYDGPGPGQSYYAGQPPPPPPPHQAHARAEHHNNGQGASNVPTRRTEAALQGVDDGDCRNWDVHPSRKPLSQRNRR